MENDPPEPEPLLDMLQSILVAVATVEVTADTEPEAAEPTLFDAAGAEVTFATTVNESVPATVAAGRLKVTGIEHKVAVRHVGTVPIVIDVASRGVADADGTTITLSRPKPRDATATSATRLKVVFVDICFLSISRDREFPVLGFELIS